MAYTKFKELDPQSIKQWYEKNERRRQLAEQKRRQEHDEQQKKQQQQKQAQSPSTALATVLEQHVEVLGATEAQTTSWANSDLLAIIGDLDFGSVQDLRILEAYTQCDFAPTVDTSTSWRGKSILG
ncbi:hypothetical protein LY76DRAFT_651274 [Colletotrichum caudatum]|nr:hypothetical protein LY76DRAFT_651274 [Colletotrichum caudatum]